MVGSVKHLGQFQEMDRVVPEGIPQPAKPLDVMETVQPAAAQVAQTKPPAAAKETSWFQTLKNKIFPDTPVGQRRKAMAIGFATGVAAGAAVGAKAGVIFGAGAALVFGPATVPILALVGGLVGSIFGGIFHLIRNAP